MLYQGKPPHQDLYFHSACDSLQIYEHLYDKVTPNGVTLDKCIQPSLDYTGKICGVAVGDEESYEVRRVADVTLKRVK